MVQPLSGTVPSKLTSEGFPIELSPECTGQARSPGWVVGVLELGMQGQPVPITSLRVFRKRKKYVKGLKLSPLEFSLAPYLNPASKMSHINDSCFKY